jgi:hypothetical protein
VGKAAPERRTELRHAPRGGKLVESRHQRILQGRRDRERGKRSRRLECILTLSEPVGLEHHLRQLLDEERHAVGLLHDLLDDLRGQRLAASDFLHEVRDIARCQALQIDVVEVGVDLPRCEQ